jgi:hypothetical protein
MRCRMANPKSIATKSATAPVANTNTSIASMASPDFMTAIVMLRFAEAGYNCTVRIAAMAYCSPGALLVAPQHVPIQNNQLRGGGPGIRLPPHSRCLRI